MHFSTCPLCREKWPSSSTAATNGNAAAGPSFSADGYQNFAAQAGISTTRDTSTCMSSHLILDLTRVSYLGD